MDNGSSNERIKLLRDEAEAHALRRDNIRALLSSLAIAAGLTLVVMASYVGELLDVKAGYLVIPAAMLVGLGTAEVISLYLKGRLIFGTTTTVTFSSSQDQVQGDVLAVLEKLEERLKISGNPSFEAAANFGREEDVRLIASREVFTEAKRRLSKQAELLERRARVNLATGSSTTLVAVVLLLVFAVSPIHLVELSWQMLLSLYLPKLGVVIMLEVFAFFFLRIYKASLEDSRALNRDLDMLALKEVALITSWAEGPEYRLEAARMLATTDGAQGASLRDSNNPLDPKVIAELAAAIAKIVRGG